MTRRINPKLLLVLIACLLIAGLVAALLLSGRTARLHYDILENGVRGTGLFIRDELLCDLGSYEKINYHCHIDGDRLEKDTVVAEAYKKGFNRDLLTRLAEARKNIIQYQNHSVAENYADEEVVRLNFEINVLLNRMTGQTSDHIGLYASLCDLMRERMLYFNEHYASEANTYLQDMLAGEESTLASLAAWYDTFLMPSDGYIGYYCDGLENELNSSVVGSLDEKKYTDYLKKEPSAVNGFKCVVSDTWYVCVSVPDTAGFNENSVYPVWIGGSDTCEEGTLVAISGSRRGGLLTFRFEGNVEKYLTLRTAELFIGERVSGYVIPEKLVHDSFVTVRREGKKTQVSVNVLGQYDGKAVLAVRDDLVLNEKVYP